MAEKRALGYPDHGKEKWGHIPRRTPNHLVGIVAARSCALPVRQVL